MEKYISFSTIFNIIELNVQGDQKANVLIETNEWQAEDITAVWPCNHVIPEICDTLILEEGQI